MIPNSDLLRALVALVALLTVAHGTGAVFGRFKQPKVIGEILGGLLLGPTVLGAFAPDAVAWMFTESTNARSVIGMVQQLGLFLLMFCSGIEARRRFRSDEKKIVTTMSVTGLVLPFLLGILAVRLLDMRGLWGEAGTSASFLLVFSSAIAVTSIPVISRIMHDLGILKTGFARIVLGVAIVEDVVLYAVLAVAIDLSGHGGGTFGLPALLGLAPGSAADIAYHVALTVGLLVALFAFAPPVNRWIGAHPRSLGPLTSTARRLIFLLAVVVLYLLLDLESFLGAFVAGVVVGTSRRNEGTAEGAAAGHAAGSGSAVAGAAAEEQESASESQDPIRHFAYAFFIPVYFALVGVNLNLRRSFEPGLFALFFVFACVAKAASVYFGGRLARLAHRPSLNLAVALNARGGPGIVLATVTFGAGIIHEEFYIWLILLAVLTSLMAGSFMQRLPKSSFDEDLVLGMRREPLPVPVPAVPAVEAAVPAAVFSVRPAPTVPAAPPGDERRHDPQREVARTDVLRQ